MSSEKDFFEPNLDFDGISNFLNRMEWTPSMIDHFKENIRKTPIRYYVYDDSGSMISSDGLKKGFFKKYLRCSRWEELIESMKFQFNVSFEGNIPSKFLFLNNETVYSNNDSHLNKMLKMTGGDTPLCKTINIIAEDIESYKDRLIELNKRVTVFIATDGEASDGDITIPLKRLKDLPVDITIRLCTNKSSFIDYWKKIDEDINIIYDFWTETKEIYDLNPEICYSEAIHQYREFGVKIPEFNILNTVELNQTQLKNFAAIIYGRDFSVDDPLKNNLFICSSYTQNIYRPFCVTTNSNREYVTFPVFTGFFFKHKIRSNNKKDKCIIC